MKKLPVFAATLILAACAAPQPGREEAGLEAELASRTAGPPADCADGGAGDRLIILDRGVVGVRRGDTLWVSRLAPECRYMAPLDTLVVEAHESRFCRGDRVRAVSPGQSIPGPACPLEPFTPYRAGR